MKILVVNADCITVNSSANLCHLAYLNGLINSGHEVALLSADGRDYKQDPSMKIPEGVQSYTYYGVSLYEKMSLKKAANNADMPAAPMPESVADGKTDKWLKRLLKAGVSGAKKAAISAYGVHGIYATFARRASKFHSDEEYDFMLSLSTPVASHLLAYNLLRSSRVKAKKWIQIWEDPWYSDAYGFNRKPRIYREEKRLLSFAQKVCYVSPLTLENQKKLLPEYADKMYWQPLPFYYKADTTSLGESAQNCFGYFGDYVPEARNLKPFYEAAKETGVEVHICGNPSNLFETTEHIHIHPRLSLDKLKPIEDSTNVLIFLCNRKGGQIPGKIYQYSATNKTILFIIDGTEEEQKVLQEFFGKYERYVFCQNTKEDITRAIRKIEAGDLGTVKNVPLEDFDPRKTIRNILNG